ncbi:MAG: DUF1028 domain-containing protein [Acidiferrobacterales bacterium]|nr:DUF1028 domain-containing protein [Acidiferrobacterales bacterium]
MTFSIVAFDRESGAVGVAITTSSIAVGSRCPWVRAGVGAVATQNITDPTLGNAILDLIQSGVDAKTALDATVSASPSINYRQLTVVDTGGTIAHYTGKHILGTNAVATGEDCIAAGNLLANESVPPAMVSAFCSRKSGLNLAESLIRSLLAGIDAGGEQGPVHSAAVLVACRHSWPEVDLRVDWDDSDPVGKLYGLWEAYRPQREDYLLRAVSPEAAPSYGVPGDL